jgi:hypothetical protein
MHSPDELAPENPYGVTVDGKRPPPGLRFLEDLAACVEEGGREAEARREAGAPRTWGSDRMIEGGRAARTRRNRVSRLRLKVANPTRRARSDCRPQRRPRARRAHQSHAPPADDSSGGEPEPGEDAGRADTDDVDGADLDREAALEQLPREPDDDQPDWRRGT